MPKRRPRKQGGIQEGYFEFRRARSERGTLTVTVETSLCVPKPLISCMEICLKRHKPSWAPSVMVVTKKYAQKYRYKVFRHPDGSRRRTPRKCTVREEATYKGNL